MDGNGRWAQMRGLSRPEGHAEGARAVREAVRSCRKHGVKYLTLYAFSVANWGRPRPEVRALMNLLSDFAGREKVELKEQGIRLNVVGDLDPSACIAFARGSAQALHQDAAVFHIQPKGFLFGCWIACEDIQADSGPLVYCPGSHRAPWFADFNNYPQTNLRNCRKPSPNRLKNEKMIRFHSTSAVDGCVIRLCK
jgi:hypothetical protein